MARQNLALLRYAATCGLGLNWNLLYGLPGDDRRRVRRDARPGAQAAPPVPAPRPRPAVHRPVQPVLRRRPRLRHLGPPASAGVRRRLSPRRRRGDRLPLRRHLRVGQPRGSRRPQRAGRGGGPVAGRLGVGGDATGAVGPSPRPGPVGPVWTRATARATSCTSTAPRSRRAWRGGRSLASPPRSGRSATDTPWLSTAGVRRWPWLRGRWCGSWSPASRTTLPRSRYSPRADGASMAQDDELKVHTLEYEGPPGAPPAGPSGSRSPPRCARG